MGGRFIDETPFYPCSWGTLHYFAVLTAWFLENNSILAPLLSTELMRTDINQT